MKFKNGMELNISPLTARGVPKIRVGGENYQIHQFMSIVIFSFALGLRPEGDVFVAHHNGEIIELDRFRASTLIREYFTIWSKFYLPKASLKGATVLDAGAGCGETAHFFFQHGAAKVIAVERDPNAVSLLRKNSIKNKWKIEILEDSLQPWHVRDLKYDFAKIDVEGGEKCLLQLESLPFETVIEAHSKELTQGFVDKLHMNILKEVRKDKEVCILGSA